VFLKRSQKGAYFRNAQLDIVHSSPFAQASLIILKAIKPELWFKLVDCDVIQLQIIFKELSMFVPCSCVHLYTFMGFLSMFL
jgi:hypothetical protein